MSMTKTSATRRIVREMSATEACIDDAIISVSQLMVTLVQARRDTNVAPTTGQVAIQRLARAQTSLVTTSNDVLRVHGALRSVGRETGMLDLHEDCKGAATEAPLGQAGLSLVA